MRRAVFLDRDGVVNRDRADYVKNLEEFELFPEEVQAAAELSRRGAAVVLVSNQSGVDRGYLTCEDLDGMTDRLRDAIERFGGRLDGIYYCPHGPAAGCDCRKPLPGLLLRAARDLSIDLSRSVMVGDAERDLRAGQAAGAGAGVLVLTGKTPPDKASPWEQWAPPPDHVAPSLAAAVPWIVEKLGLEEKS